MTSSRSLTLTGAHRDPYVLGEALWLWDGPEQVGTLNRVEVSDDGSLIQLGGFAYADTRTARRAATRKLTLFELMAFIVAHAPRVAEIRLDMDHRLELQRDGVALASERSRLLRSMGAEEIKIIPALGEAGDGHFALEAVWRNTPDNRAALAGSLARYRQAHAARLAPLQDWQDRLRTWGRSLRR